MNSPEHKAILFDPEFFCVGIGVDRLGDKVKVTAVLSTD